MKTNRKPSKENKRSKQNTKNIMNSGSQNKYESEMILNLPKFMRQCHFFKLSRVCVNCKVELGD